MKLISMILVLCLSMNVFAGATQELERSLDDYQYALTVEWDQKNTSFYEKKTQEFFGKIAKLINEQGLTQVEVLALAEKKMNKNAFEALKLKFSVLSPKSSPKELANLIKESSKGLYSQGASWNGETVVPVVAGLLVAAVIGYALWWSATHECVAWEEQYVCHTYNNCHGSYGYNDPYGGYGSGYCYGTSYTSCGYEDVCTKYAKKD